MSLIFKIADFPVLTLCTFSTNYARISRLYVALGFFNAKYYMIRPHCLLYYFFSVLDYDLSKLLKKMNMMVD
jgi:hypothetical protein